MLNNLPEISRLKDMLSDESDDFMLYDKIGEQLKESGDFNLAHKFFEKAIGINPEYPQVYWHIGDLYARSLNDPINAIKYFEKYLEKDPKNAITYDIVGNLYSKIDKFATLDSQIRYFKKSLELMPNFAGSVRNLAFAYSRNGQNQEALDCFKRLFEIGAMPDDYFAYACLQIKLGNFEEGWKFYQYRFLKSYGATPYPKFNKPIWEGQNISDKVLLVQYEQGFGDSIQFFRYLEQLKKVAQKVIFRVQDELFDLFNINSKDIEIVKASEPIDESTFDYHVPLMNLLHLLNARIDNIPLVQGYIKPDASKISDYKNNFFNNDCFKIGISWHGSEGGNRLRNIPLEVFYPLTKLKNVKLYSFQKGFASNQLEKNPEGVEIIDLAKTFYSFSETAAAIENLDIFITSDNAVFNLAAAMGKKTFLLLNKHSEWRWFFDNNTTPWYECVRIFKKQNENDSWHLVMDKVISELSSILLSTSKPD